MRKVALVVCLVGTLFLAGCSGDGETDGADDEIPAACGLPSPRARIPEDVVPAEFLLGGTAQLTAVSRERGGYLASMNLPLSVEEGLKQFRAAIKALGFEIIASDNEIFEAEIYIRRGKEVGAIQIRRSTCDEASIAFVNVIDSGRSGEQVPLPVPSGAKTPSTATP